MEIIHLIPCVRCDRLKESDRQALHPGCVSLNTAANGMRMHWTEPTREKGGRQGKGVNGTD